MDDVSLNSLAPGERGLVKRVEGITGGLRQRLMEMGIIPGTLIELVRCAPFGDPLEVRIRGYHLSLRRVEAEAIIIHREPG